LLAVFIASYIVVLAATPVAIRIARSTNFLDRPRGFRAHGKPTPYLGGAAVFVGFLAGALVQGTLWDSHLSALFAGAGVLWLVGTVDDRVALEPWLRVFAEVTAGILLWNGGLGWSLFPGDVADLIVTVLWVVGLVNAFNLMDNLDGAASAVAAVCAAGIAFLTVSQGPATITALAVAVSAACLGFLHYNLARPARIFLGDGGSMLLGFLVAALIMAAWRENVMEGVDFLPAIMLAGLPVLDMTLVIVSRKRRGVSVATGGRDHTTHRLLAKLGSPWRVALALGLAQGALSLAAIEMMSWEAEAVLTGATVCFLLGVATIALLESSLFRPDYPMEGSGDHEAEGIRFPGPVRQRGGM
jgi:UDP-GlcNAc:undecaprenyl-phosphate GlcNAc-1-phosphate transferase